MGGLPRNPAAAIERAVSQIVRGEDLAVAYAALASRGDAAIDAVDRAIREGCPADRHRNDWHSDLVGVLIRVANVDPWPLVARIRAGADGSHSMLWALDQSEHPDTTAALAALLDHDRAYVREQAAIALGRRQVAAALEPLLDLLRARYLNFAALEAVAGYRDPRIIEPLELLLARGNLPIGAERIARDAIARARGV